MRKNSPVTDQKNNDKASLPDEVKNFHHQKLPQLDTQAQINEDQLKICNDDFKWRVKSRGKFGWTIVFILIGQHVFLFTLIGFAYWHGCLKDIQWLVCSFFIGLFTETYFTVNVLIKWLFSEIPYFIRAPHISLKNE